MAETSQLHLKGSALSAEEASAAGLAQEEGLIGAQLLGDEHKNVGLPSSSVFQGSGSRVAACKPLQEADFRKMSIIPSKEELLGQLHMQAELPKNRVHGERYGSVSEYLATHFLLLREDCTQALRQGIQALSKRLPDCHDIQVYRDARLLSIRCGKFGMEYRLSFHRDSNSTDIWGSSKSLMEGSLLCISSDGFQTLLWAITSGHRKVCLDGNCMQLRCLDNMGEAKLEYGKRYTMLESPPAFFEAYRHVLENLQKPELTHLPFAEHLVSLEPQVDAPVYLYQGYKQDEYDFSCAFPEMQHQIRSSVFPVLQDWPSWSSSLDPSQVAAVRHGITKRLALIQGPPGTGKTFVGKMIVKILLNNLWRCEATRSPSTWGQDWDTHEPKRVKLDKEELVDGPLLILCYTNHALDQFLEGVFEFEKSLIRYGGRSTSSKLMDCTVKQWVKKERRGFLRFLWGRYRAILRRGDKLRIEISRCHALMHLDHVTLEPLREVATLQQVENLFFCGTNPKTVQLWLQGLHLQSAHQLIQGLESAHVKSVRVTRYSETMRVSDLEPGNMLHDEEEENADFPGDLNFEEPYVWMLGKSVRRALHAEWLKRIKGLAEKRLSALSEEYQSLCARRVKMDEEIHLSILRGANVIGMTTTAAARCRSILMELKPKVIVVEEAAEILEAHIIACLTPFTQHLILIGDHLQLRPSVAVNRLATDCHLDVSLFERLVTGGVEHVTLEYQRRMRPCISRLLHSLYPALKDHDSVFGRKNVEGLLNNVFFVDHRSEETRLLDSKSKVNIEESLFVVELYLYILKQGSYQTTDIAILTMYRAQMQCIKNLLQEKLDQLHSLPKDISEALLGATSQITCVDDYQGEESNIIILSLVRNICSGRDTESIGFLENPNRVCVALSRARKGLYIFGNAELLSSKSKLWQGILEDLKRFKSVGRCLTLVCPNHFLAETKIYKAQDFGQTIDGGCSQKCSYKLECGHLCPRSCHPGGHEQAICPKRCAQLLPCRHHCMQKCHGMSTCPPCRQKVSRRHPLCGHRQLITCSLRSGFQCEEQCAATLQCGHKCAKKCGQECTRWCFEMVQKELPCGHFATIPCCQPPSKFVCRELCGQSLKPACNHLCQAACTSCRRANVHPQCCQQCEKVLPCGHRCKSLCYQTCQPCTEPCENKCCHRQCQRKCGDLCQPCEALCLWICEHYKCNLKCHEVCNRPRCNQKCTEVLKCGHDCIGLCGEPCPTICRSCHPHTLEIFSQLPLKEMETSTRFVQLLDCGHLCEFSILDDWMDMDEAQSTQMPTTNWPKSCPRCKTPIRKTVRYRSLINSILIKLEESKKQIVEDDFWSRPS